MDHSYYRDRLSAYFDGELPAGEQREIKLHLDECRECRELLDKMAGLDRLVSERGDLPEDGYWEQSARRIEAQLGRQQDESVTDVREQTTWQTLRWKLAAAAASIAVLTFIAVHRGDILWDAGQEMPPRPTDTPAISEEKPEATGKLRPREIKKREGVQVSSGGTQADEQRDVELSPRLRAPSVSEPAALVALPETVAIAPAAPSRDLSLTTKPKAAAAPEVPAEENELLTDQDDIGGAGLPEKVTGDRQESPAIPSTAQLPVTPSQRVARQDQRPVEVTAPVDIRETFAVEKAATARVVTAHDRDTVELARWRHIRDSLIVLTKPRQLPKAPRTVAVESKDAVDSTEVNITMRLMEAYCHVALLTDDENEYHLAADFLRETATGGMPFSEQAKACLKQLEGRFE